MTQSLILATKREWIAFRAKIKGIEEGLEEEDDEDTVLPDPIPGGDDFFHEDLFDNWRRSADPERPLGASWTGKTECERTDGNWIPFDPANPGRRCSSPRMGKGGQGGVTQS